MPSVRWYFLSTLWPEAPGNLVRGGRAAGAEFEALCKQQCWQKCPCCSAVCERPHGCNFMTCYSEQCRGKKYFCYLCGMELTAMQHFSHFPHGIFENACETVDRRDEEGLPQATW